ncbi:MAG: TraA family conjugative transfer protein [Methylophilus sp.]|uniref:TraA family conjugative transfer protein n=1 Tax=Methylophilus sp. TaxID=29541 RepID=UPI003F9FB37F
MSNKKLVVLSALGFSGSAFATTGSSDFTAIADMLQAWSSGTLGKLIAGEAMVAGVAYGIVRQNIFAVIISVAAALIMSYGPAVLTDFSSFTV